MDVLYTCSAGLDVHKKSIAVCVRKMEKDGKTSEEVRKYGTMTSELLDLRDWLEESGVTHVAMESTGVYWKPICNLLEDRFQLVLCNARHVKQVPGRKTDVKDCQWLAQLLQHGLLRSSFVPPRPQRELRDLTRHRSQIVSERARITNRIHKVLEDANIKLHAVASDVMGVSGRSMLEAIIAGEDNPRELAEKARKRLRNKIPELTLALEGRITDHHRFMLKTLYRHWVYLGELVDEMTERIETLLHSLDTSDEEDDVLPFEQAVDLLITVPGIDVHTAHSILAEIGTDMSRFPSHGHLASWAGMCPGNNESAGKRRTGKTTKGSKWLKATLSQASWAASRTRKTYLSEQYRRIVRRRGKKRALVAVGHSILVIIYHMLKYHRIYEDLGQDYFDQLNTDRLVQYHIKRLEALRITVHQKDIDCAA